MADNIEDFELSNLKSKLNERDPSIDGDPSDVISDTSEPVYVKKSSKRKNPLAKLEAGKITAEQISNEVRKAFDIKTKDTDPTNVSSLLDANKRRNLLMSNIAQTLAQEKNLNRIWLPKLRGTLPQELYGTVKITTPSEALAQHQQLIATIDRQRRMLADQFVRQQTRDMHHEKIMLAAHSDKLSLLGKISSDTSRINNFFDTYVKRYMMTSIELKFKHIFVSQDILKYTKVLIDTLSAKLDSVKHNTSLSDVAKISAIAEFKRTVRIKASSMLADAALAPIKEPISRLVSEIVGQVRDEATKKYQESTGSSPIEFDDKDDGSITAKTRNVARKARSKFGHADRTFNDASMRKIVNHDDQTGLSKALEATLNILKPGRATGGKNFAGKSVEETNSDVMVSLLAKIHQQVTKSSRILDFNARKDLTPAEQKYFDRHTATEELRFDKSTNDFTSVSDLNKRIFDRFFGDKEKQADLYQPIVNQMFKGYKTHGGDEATFKAALPDIVLFITNITKHAKVVKLNHIKKYLRGEKLSAFEQSYLDAIFVDISDDSKKELAAILQKTFFKDIEGDEADTELTNSVGSKLSDLIKYRENDLKKLDQLSRQGDLRGTDFIDARTGDFDHTKLRQNYSNLDISRLSSHLGDEIPDKETLSSALARRMKQARQNRYQTNQGFGDIDELTDITGIENHDNPKVSGPGLYFQGSDKEFHIPFDKISGSARDIISKIIDKENPDKNALEPYSSKTELDTNVDSISILNERLETSNAISNAQLEALNAIIGQLGSLNNLDLGSMLGRQSSFIGKAIGVGKKGLTAYTKGVGKFYGGLFKLTGSGIGAIKNGIKGKSDILGSILSTVLSGYTLPIKLGVKAIKGGFALGKKLFDSKDKYVDVYRKGDIDPGNPLIKGTDIRNGKYSFIDGRPLASSYGIDKPVISNDTQQTVITKNDIEIGLVDVDNKSLKSKDSIAKRILGKIGTGLKGIGTLAMLPVKLLEGLSSILTGFGSKKKNGLVDKLSLEELVTKHLIKITDLLTPISAKFQDIREGSYADYKRDREEESKHKRSRVKDIVTSKNTGGLSGLFGGLKKSGIGLAGGMAAAGGLKKLLGFGDGEGAPEESGPIDTAVKTGTGAAAWYGTKQLAGKMFGKKAAEVGAQQAVKHGLLRSSISALGRLGIGQAIRTAAVDGVAALATAASSPVILSGLAIAGIGAGGYVLWDWSKGKDRRKAITKIRNAVYKVPENKLGVLIDLEDDLSRAISDQNKSELMGSKLQGYIEDLGLDPEDKRQFTFFKHWYATMFFPVFKASVDIIEKSFKIKFVDQDDMSDDQINEYKKSIESSPIYEELKESKFELSKAGFKLWQQETFFKDGEYTDKTKIQQNLDKRLETTSKLINDNKSVAGLSFEKMLNKGQPQLDNKWDVNLPGTPSTADFIKKNGREKLKPSSADSPERSLEQYQKSYGLPGSGTILNSKGKASRAKTWKNVERPLIEQLIRLGWTKEQAIGIAANIYNESKGVITAVGDNGHAYGLAQWQEPRQQLFAQKFKKDIRQATFAEQVAFIDYELRNGDTLERKAGRKLMESKTPEEAAAVVAQYYERPADSEEYSKRAALASSMKRRYSDMKEEDISKIEGSPVDTSGSTSPMEAAATTISSPGSAPGMMLSSGGGAMSSFGTPSVFASGGSPAGLNPDVSGSVTSPGGGSQSASLIGDITSSGGGSVDASADLGEAVAKYESGKRGYAAVSTGSGDPGGASYGKYQLSSNAGTLDKYLKTSGYGNEFKGLAPGSAEFNAKWKELAAKDEKFGKSQNEFIQRTHYEPAFKKAKALGFDTSNRGIQEAIWSGSIQHGGINKILAETASIPGFDKMNPKEQIAAFYQKRGDYAAYHMRKAGAPEKNIQNASYGRYKREIKDVLALADARPNDVEKLPESIPSPVVDQPKNENPTLQAIQEKDIKAGLPKSEIPAEVKKSIDASPISKPKPTEIAKGLPKPIEVTPSQNPESTKPVIIKPTDTKNDDIERLGRQQLDDIRSGKAARKSAIYEELRAKGVPALEAGRQSTAQVNEEFAQKATAPKQVNDYVDQFSSGKLNPTSGVSTGQIPPATQTPQLTPQPAPVPTTPNEITVNDPEAKNQTSLLEQQNQLLTQIAGLLKNPSNDKEKVTPNKSDNSAVVSKLDEVIQAISLGAQAAAQATPQQQTGVSSTRNVVQPKGSGINVGREKVS